MPLVSIGEELKRAQAGGYALPLFDTADVQSTEGMIQALEDRKAPAMIALYSGALERPNGRAMAAYIRTRAEEASVPISLMLDHGSSFENVMHAIAAGFTDVMYDGSSLPFEENVAQTKAVVRAAHAVGLCVEAELGHVGQGASYDEDRDAGLTKVDEASEYVERSGCDALAVAVGTAHGVYTGTPKLDFQRLAELNAAVSVPLVLHGGSGSGDENLVKAIAGGITKINIAADLFIAGQKNVAEDPRTPYFVFDKISDGYKAKLKYYMELFGETNAALKF